MPPARLGCHIGAGLICAEVNELSAALWTSRLLPGRWQRSFRDSPSQRWRDLLLDSGVLYLHLAAPASLATRLPPVAMTWDRFSAPTDRAAAFRSFVSRIEKSDRPQVIFLHTQLPHHPWVYLPSGTRIFDALEEAGIASAYDN